MRRRILKKIVCVALLAAGVAGCAAVASFRASYGRDFLDPHCPRYEGDFTASPHDPRGVFRVVSFNVHFSKHPLEAVSFLRAVGLASAEVLLLQEMNLPAVMIIADALRMRYVYYPAARHPYHGDLFGVAIVTRQRILDDRKILLPDLSDGDAARKVVMMATLDMGGTPVRLASVHLQSSLPPIAVGDQLQVIADCVLDGRCPGGPATPAGSIPVVIGGDFNTPTKKHRRVMHEVLLERGLFPIRGIGSTHSATGFRLDHLFASPRLVCERGSAFVLEGSYRDVSDHYPIAVRLDLQ